MRAPAHAGALGCPVGSRALAAELDQPWAIQCTVVSGKVVRCRTFLSWGEVLKAVGIEE